MKFHTFPGAGFDSRYSRANSKFRVNFHREEPSFNYRVLRLVSSQGTWELGLGEYQSGFRLRMGLMGRPPSLMDFCLGRDGRLCWPVLRAVLQILATAPEASKSEELDALFPWAGTRPDLTVHLEPLLRNREPG